MFSYEGEEALLLLQQTSLFEQPAQQQQEEEAILSYQRTPFVAQQEDCLVEVKSRIDGEKEKQLLCREWIGDEATSDYSSQSSSAKGEIFPFGLTLEEKALLKLEEVIAPLELEAAEAITAVKMGEGISRLEEVGQLLILLMWVFIRWPRGAVQQVNFTWGWLTSMALLLASSQWTLCRTRLCVCIELRQTRTITRQSTTWP